MSSQVVPSDKENGGDEADSKMMRIEPFEEDATLATYFVHRKTRTVCIKSLFVFDMNGGMRRGVIWLVEHSYFDRFILSLIVINSILLSIQRYRYPDAIENKMGEYADFFLTPCFTLESILKIIAFGFCMSKNSYLRDAWNWLDLVVVITACISLGTIIAVGGGGGSSLAFLRVFRVLRPLRSLTMLPEMRVLVNTILCAIPRLGNVLGMGIFLFVVFGILALNFWGGMFYRQCRGTERPVFVGAAELDPEVHGDVPCWSWPPQEERLCGGRNQCMSPLGVRQGWCGSIFEEDSVADFRPTFCIDGVCKEQRGDTPWCDDSLSEDVLLSMAGAIHFDHLPGALLVVFQCMTCEGWTDVMYLLQDAHSDFFASVYFCMLILLTSFFLLNVALAVMGDTFSSLSQAEDEVDEDEDDESQKKPAATDAAGKPAHSFEDAEVLLNRGQKEEDKDSDMDDENPFDDPLWIDTPPVRGCRAVAFSEVFTTIIMFFILCNVLTMMLDQHPPPGRVLQSVLNYTEIIFTVTFTVEMVIMLAAVGPKKYVTNPVMCFDGIIVVASLVEMSMDGGGGAIRAMRGFRLLRIFKLAKKWTSFRILLKSMIHTCLSLGNFTLLLVLMLYVFTLMGMNFFALKFHFEDGEGPVIPCEESDGTCEWCPGGVGDQSCVPRANFDTFLWAFVTIFQIMSGENWNTVMYDGMKAVGWPAVFFFLALIIVGQCIIFNLFLAILMAQFEEASTDIREKEMQQTKAKQNQKQKSKTLKTPNQGSLIAPNFAGLVKTAQRESTKGTLVSAPEPEDAASPAAEAEEKQPEPPNPEVEKPEEREPEDLPTNNPNQTKADDPEIDPVPNPPSWQTAPTTKDPPADASSKVVPMDSCDTVDFTPHEKVTYIWPIHHSFLLLTPDNQLRMFCKRVVTNKQFDNLILTCILISCFCMAIDNPLADPSSDLAIALSILNYIFSVIFLAEMLMKMVSNGFLFGKEAYWRNSWNILDGVVVIVSIIDWAAANSGMTVLKTLRILRAFRPLRVISRNENLKLVVNTLFKSVPELCNLLIVGFLFFLIFGLFALGYFKGGFYMCQLAGEDGLEGHSYAVTMSYQDVINSNGTIVSRTAPGDPFNGTFTAKVYTDAQMTPVCASPDGALTALGELDDEGVFHVGGECDGVHWQRPSFDTPICVGHCDPRIIAKGKPRAPVDLCPPPLERVEELPSLCSAEDAPIALREAQKSGRVDFTPEDEEKGTTYFDAMQKLTPMACGGGPELGFKGCRETYCPDGSETDPDIAHPGLKETCADECDNHLYYCQETCKNDGEACDACKAQCRAACECPRFCDASTMEAAMCVEQGGHWIASLSQSFDNILSSMLTLFEISTTEGWVDVMWSACDSMGPYMEPQRDVNEVFASLFFCLFILVGTFFILNLCVGVIVDNFNKIKDSGGSIMMTEAQANWSNTMRNFLTRKQFFGLTELDLKPPAQQRAYGFVTHPYCEMFIMTCIILNTVLMGCKQFPTPSESYEEGIKAANYALAVVFMIEAGIKLFALRENYFQDGWNSFDFSCVCATLIGFIVDRATSAEIGPVMSAIRIFRIARLFRLVRFAKGLNRLFTAFVLSIPRLLNVVAILLLLLFLFSVLGVQLFAKIKFDPNGGPHDTFTNFHDFYRAFMALVRSMTGEGWNELMHSLSRDEVWFAQTLQAPCYEQALMDDSPSTWRILKAKCIIDQPNGCGTDVSYAYFICYTWAITFVILNLVIAVILEGFDDSSKDDCSDIVDSCVSLWKKYDTNCDMKLSLKHCFEYIEELAVVNNARPIDLVPEEAILENGTIDLTHVRLSGAYASNVMISPDQEVHFIHAVKWGLRISLSQNNPEMLKEIDDAGDDARTQKLEEDQCRRQRLYEVMGEPVFLSVLVAVAKIQHAFRIKQERRRKNPETTNKPRVAG